MGTSRRNHGQWSAHIHEAAERFGLPKPLLRAVMHAESVGDPHALSPKDAMGLMQIMPATWQELRAGHYLGDDPLDPRDNVIAGAAYLRQMLDQFGQTCFLVAYHAGPTRYQEYIAIGRPLPAGTFGYVEKIAPLIDGMTLAVSISERRAAGLSAARSAVFVRPEGRPSNRRKHSSNTPAGTLFAPIRSRDPRSPAATSITDLTAVKPALQLTPVAGVDASKPSEHSLFARPSAQTTR